ncbi:hypothetical protein AWC17_26585 [Mycobacterium nebraskense]|uniref:Lipoprotein LpqS n=1 Tax=Mycobacterium nebraskense TaxID=244292 RepID=A0A0F5NFY1_9MYCO|nr:hypothetical protein WU83_06465 [Mycobacterium nebraskense]KLO39646.1 hypothetical protein ABW17_19030 [Mycobacterium nebraskense]ORW30304.1 hypothetical protein AWC17_26585 [Mycobacterium nebraskense]
MRLIGAYGLPRWRSVIAVAAVVLLTLLVGHSALLHSKSHASHHPHALVSSLGGEFTVSANHAHLADGSLTACHDVFAAPVVTRSATTLLELGVVAAIVAAAAALTTLVAPVGRGPPRALAPVLSGQDLLTRFCLSRR